MASHSQMSRRKLLNPRPPSRGHNPKVPSTTSNDQKQNLDSHGLLPETTGDSFSFSSIVAEDSANVFQFGHCPRQTSLGSDLKQQYTFRSLHNVTPQVSPRLAGYSFSSDFLSSPPGSLSLPAPLTAPKFGPVLDTSSPKEETEGTANSNTTASQGNAESENQTRVLHRGSSVSVHLTPSDVTNRGLDSQLQSLRLSEVSIASEELRSAIAYDVRDETAPDAPFFSNKFQIALRKGLGIAKDAANVLEEIDIASQGQEALKRLHIQALELSSFQGCDTRTIAVLGDSGEGKSSLINSLLNFPEIAKTGNIGSACTSVVTEYRQSKPEQVSPIVLEVEYFTLEEIEDLIKDLLWDFRKFYLPHVETKETSAADYTRWQRESQQAWAALESAFKHNVQFTQELLTDMSDGAPERINTQLFTWANELKWPDGAKDGMWSSTANDPNEYCEKTGMFMQDRYWPFTKIIQVFVSSQVLKTGVVLADLPGLHDTNLARVRTTREYLMECDLFLIVANISRAITNQSLKSSLYTVLSQHMPLEWEETGGKTLHFAVVCTMAENFDVEKEKREFFGPSKPMEESEMARLDTEIGQAKQSGNRKLKKALKLKQEVMLLEVRNQHVKHGLQQAYAKDITDGTLPVFCVSNAWYQKYAKKGNHAIVSASGIPDLRRFCHSVTAQAQLHEAQNFLQARLMSLINSMDIWTKDVQSTICDTKIPSLEVFEDEIRKIEEHITQKIEDAKGQYLRDFDETFSRYFTERPELWQREASKRHQEWTQWHWTQYNAWCMNNGKHSTPKRPSVDWNSQIIWKMRSEIAYDWGILEEDTPTLFAELLVDIDTQLMNLKTFVDSNSLPIQVGTGIQTRISDVKYRVGLEQQSFSNQIQRIRRMTFEPSGFVLDEMLPAYQAASREFGEGKSYRQIRHVKGRLENGSLFPNIAFQTRSAVESLLDNTFTRLDKISRDTLRLIQEDISTVGPSSQKQFVTGVIIGKHVVTELGRTVEDLKKRHSEALKEIQEL